MLASGGARRANLLIDPIVHTLEPERFSDSAMRNLDLDQIWPYPQRRFNAPRPALAGSIESPARDVPADPRAHDCAPQDLSSTEDGAYDYSAEECEALFPEGEPGLPPSPLSVQTNKLAPSALPAAARHEATAGATPSWQDPPPLPAMLCPNDRPAPEASPRASTSPAPHALPEAAVPSWPLHPAPPVQTHATSIEAATQGTAPAASEALEPRKRKRRDCRPIAWTGLGFVAGILAWHVVGFWSFVSDVVLNANDADPARGATALAPKPGETALEPIERAAIAAPSGFAAGKPPPKLATRLSGGLVVSPIEPAASSCMTLALDRGSGATAPVACADETIAGLRDAGYNVRSDRLALRPRLQDPLVWTGGTAVATPPAEPPLTEAAAGTSIDYGTLQPADFELKTD